MKTSLFISLCILRDLPQQKIPRELCGRGRSPYISTFPCSHGKIFWWDGSGQFKNTRRKGADQEISKKQEGKNGAKKKKRFLHTWRFPYSCVFSIDWEHPQATTLMRPSLKRTLSHWDLPYNQTQSHFYQNALCICKDVPKSHLCLCFLNLTFFLFSDYFMST